MDELMEMLDFCIYHFDEIDVSDLVVFQKQLESWYKQEGEQEKRRNDYLKEVERIKKKSFDYLLYYDADYVMKKLNLSVVDFVRKRDDKTFTVEEIERVLK